jgi:hypothetical protein
LADIRTAIQSAQGVAMHKVKKAKEAARRIKAEQKRARKRPRIKLKVLT